MGDGVELVRCQIGVGCGGFGKRSEPAQLDRLVVDDEPVNVEWLTRSSVDPDRCAVCGEDIRRPTDGDIESCRRLVRPPPDQLPRPGVIRVVPDQLGEPLPKERELGTELIRRGISRLGRVELLGVDVENQDSGDPVDVATRQVMGSLGETGWVGEEGVVNDEALGSGPDVRHRGTGRDYERSSDDEWSAVCHRGPGYGRRVTAFSTTHIQEPCLSEPRPSTHRASIIEAW
jgi:hypothetical protein